MQSIIVQKLLIHQKLIAGIQEVQWESACLEIEGLRV